MTRAFIIPLMFLPKMLSTLRQIKVFNCYGPSYQKVQTKMSCPLNSFGILTSKQCKTYKLKNEPDGSPRLKELQLHQTNRPSSTSQTLFCFAFSAHSPSPAKASSQQGYVAWRKARVI